jgi:hypothetical protein
MQQRVAGMGGTARLSPRSDLVLNMQYDLTDSHSGFEGQRVARNRNHTADVQGQWSTRRTWVQSIAGNFRRTESSQLLRRSQSDWEGSALSTWQPGPHGRVSAGGGARRVHLVNGDDDVRYVTLLANGDARVRRGWQANGQASTTRNWDPERGDFMVSTLGGSTRLETSRRFRIDGNYQLTANADTAAVLQRYAISWNTRVQLQPLRTLQMGIALGSFRAGPGLLRPNSVSRTRSLEMRWTPAPGMDLNGSLAATGLLPGDAPRVVTRSLTVRAAPRPSVQFTGSWTSSSQERTSSESAALSGRELITGRLQLTFSRRLAGSGGLSVSSPRTSREARLYDAVMTWSFGR